MQDRGDLYGKLDAIFEKRSTEGLVERARINDEFPELTEVIGPPAEVNNPQAQVMEVPDLVPHDRRASDRRSNDRRRSDRRQGSRRGDDEASCSPPGADAEVDRLIKAMETRLGDLFSSHQSSVEDMVRQAIRIELERLRQEQG
jgi:hypothetical protein